VLEAEQEFTGACRVLLAHVGDGEQDPSERREQLPFLSRDLEFGDAALLVPGNTADAQDPANGRGHRTDNVAADAAGEVRVVAAPGVLRVEDTGPGLAEADTERAFERFYLHERYGLERQVGTGLGLAIVKELTLAMGGDVDVESRPGTLTVFIVRLQVPKVAARETLPA